MRYFRSLSLYNIFSILLVVGLLSLSFYSFSLSHKLDKLKVRIGEQGNDISEQERELNLIELGLKIQNTFRDENTSFQRALELRNMIYTQVPLERTISGFDFWDFSTAFETSVLDRETGHICGGLAILYLTGLESLGIKARYVGIFSKNTEPFDGHSTIEFFINGKWYASDPTFNVMFKHEGNYLSYAEIFNLLHEGQMPEIVSNGFELIEGRKVQDYYISMFDLYKFMVIHPETLGRGADDAEPQFLPQSWDGTIKFSDGDKDVSVWNGIYSFLANGVLR